jgi:GNAT superfamily N-acetyltransferase
MTIRILQYDQVNPLGVLHLNLLGLDYALTPERVELIRQLDPRPFPFFGLYAVDDGFVAGQVGVYRLPMMTAAGPEDVGGVYAVCTHPAFSGRGIATRLLEEAHRRMEDAGLRFSTLGTTRYRSAFSLYRQLGYQVAFTPLTTFVPRSKLSVSTHLRAELADQQKLVLADELFNRIAGSQLGFARRHDSFICTLAAIGDVNLGSVWLLGDNVQLVGYAIARILESVLIVDHLLLSAGVDAAAAVSALVEDLPISYIQIRIDRPSVMDSLLQTGFPAGRASWSTFMIKPLAPEVTVDDARRLFGIDTERFLISSIDVT